MINLLWIAALALLIALLLCGGLATTVFIAMLSKPAACVFAFVAVIVSCLTVRFIIRS